MCSGINSIHAITRLIVKSKLTDCARLVQYYGIHVIRIVQTPFLERAVEFTELKAEDFNKGIYGHN